MIGKFFHKILLLTSGLFFVAAAVILSQGDIPVASARPLFQTISGGVAADTDTGATVTTGIQLTISDGDNQSGRRTFVRNNVIDFGSVSFIHPELISNGDSYLENAHLMLEAVFYINLTFNGTSSVSLDMSKLRTSSNPFYKTYYSTAVSRSNNKTEVFEDPLKNNIGNFTESTSQVLRMVFEVAPQQQGRLTDRFRIEANAL